MIKRIFTLLTAIVLLIGMVASATNINTNVHLKVGQNTGFYQISVDGGYLALTVENTLFVTNDPATPSSLWCVTVTEENAGKAPIFDFINMVNQVPLSVSMDQFNCFADRQNKIAPLFKMGGEISGWANSPIFAEGIAEEMPMYSYYANDSVVGLRIIGPNASLETMSATQVSTSDLTKFTILPARPVVLDYIEINSLVSSLKSNFGHVKLKFVPDKNKTKLENPFSDFPFMALPIWGDEPYVNIINRYDSPAKDSILYVDTSYINTSGSKFLAFKHTAVDADTFNSSDMKDNGKFVFIYHPFTDEVTIQVKSVDYGTGKANWEKDEKATLERQNDTTFVATLHGKPVFNYVGIQDISTADSVRIVTISPDPLTSKSYLGVPSCSIFSDLTSLEDSVYTIRNAKGQYLAVPIFNCERNDESAASGKETITGPIWVDVDSAAQKVEDMPAYQWVVLKDKTNAYFANTSSVTITNREYPETTTSVQLTKTLNSSGDTIVVFGNVVEGNYNYGIISGIGDDMTWRRLSSESNTYSMWSDEPKKGLIFTGIINLSDSTIGYKTLSEKELTYNTALYSLKYFNPYTMDKYVAISDTILTATGDSTATFKIGLPSNTTKINDRYGFKVTDVVKAKIPSLVNLVRTPYVLTANNGAMVGQSIDSGSGFVIDIEDEYNNVIVSKQVKQTPFFFKENNHCNGTHYYAMVVGFPNRPETSPCIYTPNCIKLGVADNTLNAILQYQCGCERRTSSFAIEVTDLALYRHFNNKNLGEIEGRDSLKFYENVRHEYLMDENNVNLQNKNWEATNNHTIDYLGIWTKDKASLSGKALGLQLDTVWVNRGLGNIKPQYIISVAHNDVAAVDTIPCDATNHQHIDANGQPCDAMHCIHATPGHAGFEYGKYLISFADSAAVVPYTDVENGYYRLAFKKAIHIADTLIFLEDADAALAPATLSPSALIAKYSKTTYTGNGSVCPLTGDNHKNYTWAFRYTNPGMGANATEEGSANSFLIESSNFDGQSIAPENAGWVKMQNGCLTITKEPSYFNNAKTGADGALIFNVEKMGADDMVTDAATVTASDFTVIAGQGQVTINGAAGKKVVVSNILGQTVANTVLTSDNATIAAPAGVVVVAVEGEAAVKAIVK